MSDTRKKYLTVKTQLELEKREKNQILQKYETLESDFKKLLQRLRDMEVELGIYKSELSNPTFVNQIPTPSFLENGETFEEESSTSCNSEENMNGIEESFKVNVSDFEEEEEEEPKPYFEQAKACIHDLKSFDLSIKEKLETLETLQQSESNE